jgi:CheY-specific phosphatase CheX
MSDNDDLLESALTNAVSETMENMAFEQVDSLQPDAPRQENRNLWAVLPIIKPISGEISIQLSADYARVLTESLFEGSDGIPTAEMVRDALAEILNTIAGRFMSRLIPTKEEFELGLPRVNLGKCPFEKTKTISRDFDVGGQILTAYLSGIETKSSTKSEAKKGGNEI